MSDLNRKLGSVEQDNLITSTDPAPIVGVWKIRKETGKERTYKRGTVFAVDSTDNACVILKDGETLTAFAILCDDVTVGTEKDVTVNMYITGCFNPDRVIVEDGYSLKEKDLFALRQYGIIFKAALPAYSKKEEE